MNATSIHDLSELLSDDALYPAAKGYKRPDCPSFIFRDERNQEDSDTLWGRELALDFEEWQAKREQKAQYLIGELLPAFLVTTMVETPLVLKPSKSDAGFDGGIRPSPERAKEYKRVMTRPITKWEAATEIVLATMSEVEEWMERPTKDRKPVMVKRDKDGVLQEWAPTTSAEAQAFFDRQEQRGFCNWLVQWHKRRPANNDHWRAFMRPLADVLDSPTLGWDASQILKTMRDTLPFAPGPVKDTVFINPDGTRVVTRLSPGTARAGYKQRHNIEDSLVTMDRVQFEGERNSRYVIGTRKASDKTASAYYDPDPIKNEDRYVPRACSLIRLPESKVMPDEGCYVLTIRELERAIIAGADLCESELDAFANTFENEDSQFDTREAGLSFGDSCDFRTMLDMTEQESWLYWTLYSAGLEDACKELTLRECGDVQRFLPGLHGALVKMGTDEPMDDNEEFALELLNDARDADMLEQERTGRIMWSRFDYLRNLGDH